MDLLLTIYIATAIFGFGIVLIDLVSAVSGATDGDDGHADGHSGDSDGDADFNGDADGDADGGADGDGDGHEGDHDGASEAHAAHDGSHMTHPKKYNKNIIFRILGAMRSLVYFSFGFGSIGWFALATGKSVISSLIWSVSVGIIITVLAKLLRRIQRTELDSQFKNEEIIMSKADVLVSIRNGQMGKVRIHVGSSYVERYAKSSNPAIDIEKGTEVRVIDITKEYVIVE